MNKQEFLDALDRRLLCLPAADREESRSYYSEMISDRMEAEGKTEEEAVAELGSMNEIVYSILDDYSAIKLAGQRMRDRKAHASNKILYIAIMVLTSPIWAPLLLAAVIVVFAMYLSLWAVIGSLALAFICVLIAGVICVISSCVISFTQGISQAFFVLGSGLCTFGIGMYLYKPVVKACSWMLGMTKSFFTDLKVRFFARGGINA
ncbi:MAG: DUF1700 domain-containing protein [Erysipelotrichia bacterium]|nr:DUF1700 domain-containing protein [Erysipelotrichia bacterium]